MTFRAGDIDTDELRAITTELQVETDAFADYLTVRELAQIAHISRNRIRHALTHARHRPMQGVKRGVQWFMTRTEALRWSHEIARFEATKWSQNLKRIERLMERNEKGLPLKREYAQPQTRRAYTYEQPPIGQRVYTYKQTAEVLHTTLAVVYLYATQGHELGDCPRYRLEDRTAVLAANYVDALARKRHEAAVKRTERALRLVSDDERTEESA